MKAFKVVLQKQHGKREDPVRHRRVVLVVSKSTNYAAARAVVDAERKHVLLDRTVMTKEGDFHAAVVSIEPTDFEVLSP